MPRITEDEKLEQAIGPEGATPEVQDELVPVRPPREKKKAKPKAKKPVKAPGVPPAAPEPKPEQKAEPKAKAAQKGKEKPKKDAKPKKAPKKKERAKHANLNPHGEWHERKDHRVNLFKLLKKAPNGLTAGQLFQKLGMKPGNGRLAIILRGEQAVKRVKAQMDLVKDKEVYVYRLTPKGLKALAEGTVNDRSLNLTKLGRTAQDGHSF